MTYELYWIASIYSLILTTSLHIITSRASNLDNKHLNTSSYKNVNILSSKLVETK